MVDRPPEDPGTAPQRPASLERLLKERGAASAPAPAPEPDSHPESRTAAPADGQAWELERARVRLREAQSDLNRLRGIDESHQRLLALLEANSELLVSGNAHELPQRVLQIALDLVGGERAAYFRPDKQGALRPKLVLPEGAEFSAISRSMVRDALMSRHSIIHQGRATREGQERQSIIDLDLQTVVATPLEAGEKILGVLYLDGSKPGRFGGSDVPVLEIFCRLAAAAMLRTEELEATRHEKRALAEENRELKSVLGDRARFGKILAASPAMMKVIEQLRRMVRYRTTVRVFGETGTGKELISRALHYESAWADQPFVAINCGAIPETLLEAELFGHEKGAFTGAERTKPGLFEEAHGGTLFLDEIGDMPSALQVKLLRVLEDGEIRRIGAKEIRRVDVRIIAASNVDLEKKVSEGGFREDLYYRLNVLTVNIPPLRERPEDVALLTEYFLKNYARKMGLPQPRLAPAALRRLQAQPWPGNVRQLEKCIERSLAYWDGEGILGDQQLVLDAQRQVQGGEAADPGARREKLKDFLSRMERDRIVAVLEKEGGNVTRAAEQLGISRQYLHRKIRDLELR